MAADATAAGRVDALANLAGARVYIFGGGNDRVVTPPVIDSLVAFFRAAGVPEAGTLVKRDVGSGHAFILDEPANPCSSLLQFGQIGFSPSITNKRRNGANAAR